jgi:hypothetical protein
MESQQSLNRKGEMFSHLLSLLTPCACNLPFESPIGWNEGEVGSREYYPDTE